MRWRRQRGGGDSAVAWRRRRRGDGGGSATTARATRQQGSGDSAAAAATTGRGRRRVSEAEVAAARWRWRQRVSGDGSTAEALRQRRWQHSSRVGQTNAALAGRGFDQRSSAVRSANVNALKQAPRKIMLKQPETYLTFSNIIDWTFSNLDLSHYYFLLKVGE